MDIWKKSSTTALLLTRLQNSVTWTTNTHKTTTRRTGCLQPCASFVVLGSQTLTEMKRSGIEVNDWLVKAKLWRVLVIVVGKYLFFCVELRVVEQKCCPTRNLLKLSLFYRCQLRVVKRKRCVTSNLLKLSLSYRFQLRVTERKCCVTSNLLKLSLYFCMELRVGERKCYMTRNSPKAHWYFMNNYVSAKENSVWYVMLPIKPVHRAKKSSLPH